MVMLYDFKWISSFSVFSRHSRCAWRFIGGKFEFFAVYRPRDFRGHYEYSIRMSVMNMIPCIMWREFLLKLLRIKSNFDSLYSIMNEWGSINWMAVRNCGVVSICVLLVCCGLFWNFRIINFELANSEYNIMDTLINFLLDFKNLKIYVFFLTVETFDHNSIFHKLID